jgi:predicted AlkP superfamily pyrophosphatase or phosphodiesterase
MRASAATAGAVVLFFAGACGLSGSSRAQTTPAGPVPPAPAAAAAEARPERPRLVVFISVDQFRRDYVERYGGRWTAGLARLVREGAFYEHSAYPYFHTITCAGHATMSTGVYPASHGLPLNAWWDRKAGRDVPCTDDSGVKAIGHRAGPKAPTGGHSAHLLRAPTLADVLRQQLNPTPRVVSLSIKPRSAIMLAGQAGDAVVWYTPDGGPTTSTAYAASPIPFVSKFAQRNPTPRELTGEWQRLLPEDAYQHEDDGVGEHPPDGWTNTFPHPLTQTRSDGRVMSYWQSTPAADTFMGRLAMAAVDELKLGQERLDYLAISFSELDTTGHAFGPESHEVQDVLLRLDRTMGDLLDHLDAKVGKGRYVVALTGDHGVAPLPERLKSQGQDAGRVNLKPLVIELDAALSARWGKATYVSKISYTDIYFAAGVYDRIEKDPAAMAEVVAIIERTPGVAKAIRRDQIEAAPTPADDPVLVALRLSRVPDRSGDMFLVPRPYWITNLTGTTHGSPQPYDRQVPVLLFGSNIKPGRYLDPASPADLVPTLAALAGVQMPKTDGRVLTEALVAAPVPPTAASSGTGRATGAPR